MTNPAPSPQNPKPAPAAHLAARITICSWCDAVTLAVEGAAPGINYGTCPACYEDGDRRSLMIARRQAGLLPRYSPPRPLKQDEFWQAVKKVEPDAYERVLKHMQAYDPRELPEPLHGDVRCLVRRAVEAQVELSPYLQALLRLLPENRVPGSEPRVPSAPGQRSGPGPLDAPRSEA